MSKYNSKPLAGTKFDPDTLEGRMNTLWLQRQRKPFTDDRYLYFAICPARNMVKVGRTRRLNERIKELANAVRDDVVLLAAFKSAGYLEQQCHSLLRGYELGGEWFDYSDDIERLIIEIREGIIA